MLQISLSPHIKIATWSYFFSTCGLLDNWCHFCPFTRRWHFDWQVWPQTDDPYGRHSGRHRHAPFQLPHSQGNCSFYLSLSADTHVYCLYTLWRRLAPVLIQEKVKKEKLLPGNFWIVFINSNYLKSECLSSKKCMRAILVSLDFADMD